MQFSQGAVYLHTNTNMSCKFITDRVYLYTNNEHREVTGGEKWNLVKVFTPKLNTFLLSSFPPVLLSSCRPVVLSSCPLVILSSCPPILLYSYPPIFLSSCHPLLLFASPPLLLSYCLYINATHRIQPYKSYMRVFRKIYFLRNIIK